MKRIALLPNPEKDKDYKYSYKILSFLQKLGFVVMSLNENMAFKDKNVILTNMNDLLSNCDCIITLGGDGTILHLAGLAAPFNIPILGVNLGKVGYMAELEFNEIDELKRLLTGEYNIENRMMLCISLYRNKELHSSHYALNDAVISKGAISRIIDINVFSNSRRLLLYRADGLIVSTPTGSTAYSMSAGGPILEPDSEAYILTPICPYSLSSKPIVFSHKSQIEITLSNLKDKDAVLTIDGGKFLNIFENDRIIIKKSEYYTKLIKLKNMSFYEILNSKQSEGGFIK